MRKLVNDSSHDLELPISQFLETFFRFLRPGQFPKFLDFVHSERAQNYNVLPRKGHGSRLEGGARVIGAMPFIITAIDSNLLFGTALPVWT